MSQHTIQNLMAGEKSNLLSIYFSAGFPDLNSTQSILEALAGAKTDFVEIGIPFSDPLADGPTIQASGQQALNNGMTLTLLFEQLEACKDIAIPKLMMGYFNSVLRFGVEQFCERCQQVGVSGAIIPDIPLDVYEREYRAIFERYGLSMVFLVTPQTAPERIREIDDASTSFIYAVSSSSTTGSKSGINSSEGYLERLQKMNLKHPLITGFNIKDKASFDMACRYTKGAIIGSEFIRLLKQSSNPTIDINNFVHAVKGQGQTA